MMCGPSYEVRFPRTIPSPPSPPTRLAPLPASSPESRSLELSDPILPFSHLSFISISLLNLFSLFDYHIDSNSIHSSMGSSASFFKEEQSLSSIPDPEIRDLKYGPPPTPLGSEYEKWRSNYLFHEGTLMKKIRKETNHLRLKILMEIPLVFLQKTIVIIYCPPLTLSHELVEYVIKKFPSYLLIKAGDYLTTQEMYERVLEQYEPSSLSIAASAASAASPSLSESHPSYSFSSLEATTGCLFINYPSNGQEAVEFNERTSTIRKVTLFFEFDLLKLVRSKSDQWTHPPSGRVYDDEICPTKKILAMKGTKKKDENALGVTSPVPSYPLSCYVDDITSEPLVKVCLTFSVSPSLSISLNLNLSISLSLGRRDHRIGAP
jgi:hypothetical protein